MDRFKLIVDFQTGVTVGDRNAMIDAFTVDLAGAELEREEIRSTADQVVIVYAFKHARTPDEMHDMCRAIYRYLRKRREVKGICISDRSWWKPVYTPGQLDPPIDPLNPADP